MWRTLLALLLTTVLCGSAFAQDDPPPILPEAPEAPTEGEPKPETPKPPDAPAKPETPPEAPPSPADEPIFGGGTPSAAGAPPGVTAPPPAPAGPLGVPDEGDEPPLPDLTPLPGHDTLTRKIELGARNVEVRVHYPEGSKRWAEHALEVIVAALPKLERAAGFPYPRSFDLDVFQADSPSQTRGRDAFDAAEMGLWVFKNAVGRHMVRELARAWSTAIAADEWARTGLSYLYTYLALEELPWIYDARTFRDETLDTMRSLEMKVKDGPLKDWKMPFWPADPANMGPLYGVGKAFGFCYLLLKTYGLETIQGAGREIAAAKKPASTEELRRAIEKASSRSTAEEFAAWVLPTEPANRYASESFSPAALRDGDDDGLVDFEETAAATKPDAADSDGDKVEDGEEVALGRDPKAPETGAPSPPVLADGDANEWKRLNKLSIQDREGDHQETYMQGDLVGVKVSFDDQSMYVLVQVRGAYDSPDVVYNLCLDLNRNEVWDYVIGWKSEGRPWIGELHDDADWTWAEWKAHKGLRFAVKGSAAELRIPLDLFPAPPAEMMLLCYTTAQGGALEVDSTLSTAVAVAKWRADQ